MAAELTVATRLWAEQPLWVIFDADHVFDRLKIRGRCTPES
jgi:hypothetical protein